MAPPRIRLEGLTRLHASRAGDRAGIRDVDLSVAAGEFVAICGRSGSGKTTLLSLIGLMDRPDAGRYLLDGRDVTRLPASQAARLRGRRFGFVFQSFQLLPALSVRENVLLPARQAGRSPADSGRRAQALLERLGLATLANRRPAELSGGQRQRVAIARSLVNDPDTLLADEPTGNLDTEAAEAVMRCLLAGRQGPGRQDAGARTLLLVTHDAALAARADRVVTVVDGRLA